MSLPRELVYIQAIEMTTELIRDDKKGAAYRLKRDETENAIQFLSQRMRHENYLAGLRQAARIIWGETKEAELYDRATSPDDSTM